MNRSDLATAMERQHEEMGHHARACARLLLMGLDDAARDEAQRFQQRRDLMDEFSQQARDLAGVTQ